jgi:hypothetical protein
MAQQSTKSAKADGIQGTKPGFFTSLRRLERNVDEGVKTLQAKMESRQLHHVGPTDRHIALKALLQCKKEMGELKVMTTDKSGYSEVRI